MEELDNVWILAESSSDCELRDLAPATLGLTNMAGEGVMETKLIFFCLLKFCFMLYILTH